MLQGTGEAGYDRGTSRETVAALDGGEQGFVHDILGAVGNAQLQQGIAVEIGAVLLDLAGRNSFGHFESDWSGEVLNLVILPSELKPGGGVTGRGKPLKPPQPRLYRRQGHPPPMPN